MWECDFETRTMKERLLEALARLASDEFQDAFIIRLDTSEAAEMSPFTLRR
jgi:hypothetical protein